MENIFYNDWSTIGVTAAKGALIYIALIAMLRISGKRSLSKFNIFDFVITIAIGSIFASTLTSNDVKLAQAVTAIVVLLGGQYLISKLALRSESFEKLVKSDPALLFYDGEFLADTMKNERVTKREVLQAVRGSGSPSLDSVAAVILETDGTISVIGSSDETTQRNALFNSVKRNPEA